MSPAGISRVSVVSRDAVSISSQAPLRVARTVSSNRSSSSRYTSVSPSGVVPSSCRQTSCGRYAGSVTT